MILNQAFRMTVRLCLIAIFVFTATTLNAAKRNDFNVDGVYYRITSDSTVAVAPKEKDKTDKKYNQGNTALSGDIIIQEKVNNGKKEYNVTSIDKEAFSRCDKVSSITIPNSIAEIGDKAFYKCKNLSVVKLPGNLKIIGKWAFCGCKSLKSIELPESLAELGGGAFDCSGIERIVLPPKITVIPYDCFSDSNLGAIVMSDEVTKIGNSAFSNTPLNIVGLIEGNGKIKLGRTTFVELPSKLEEIGRWAFAKCINLDTVYVPDGCKQIGEEAFAWNNDLWVSVYKETILPSKLTCDSRIQVIKRYSTSEELREEELKRIEEAKAKELRDSLNRIRRDEIMGEVKWAPGLSEYKKEILEGIIGEMLLVEGGTFMMGEQVSRPMNVASQPVHKVTVSPYMIGHYQINQKQWGAIMGYNPSRYGGDNLPVEMVSWKECQDFVKELRRLTGLRFTLPTEAQWEYACRFVKILRYKFKEGGVSYEWCNDIYGPYSAREVKNPIGATEGNTRVIRDFGSYFRRDHRSSGHKDPVVGLRVAISKNYKQEKIYTEADSLRMNHPLVKRIRWAPGINDDRKEAIREAVGDMVRIPGGSYTFRGEVTEYAPSLIAPGARVSCRPFYMSKYEITKALWIAVLPEYSEELKNTEMTSAVEFKRKDIAKFINELYRITGLTFSLPTEVQWEWAARGGNESRGCNYAGTNNKNDILSRRIANELGLYDMSHGVWEMCIDVPVRQGGYWNTEYTVLRGGRKPNGDPISIYERESVNYDIKSGFRLIMDIK